MSDIYVVDPHIYRTLSDKEQERIAAGLIEMGLTLNVTAVVYTDESGNVVGALRLVVDEAGRRTGATEPVGVTL